MIKWTSEKRKISDLIPAPYNPRHMTDKQAEDLDTSLTRFSLADPIIINADNKMIGGHQRLKILIKQGAVDVDVRVPDRQLTEAEEKELNLRLNKNLGEWNFELLAGFDKDMLADVGFSSEEIDEIFSTEVQDKDESIPEVKRETTTKRGDIFQIGNHRIMCGDSTITDDVGRLMDGRKARVCFTSPPYWVGFSYENESEKITIVDHIKKQAEIMCDVVESKIFINTGNIASITTAEKITGKKQIAMLIDWWQEGLRNSGFLMRHLRIWAKPGGVTPSRPNDKADMHWEYIGTFSEEQATAGMVGNFYKENREVEGIKGGSRYPWAVMGVWTDIIGKARESGHVAAFPVLLPLRYFLMYTERNDVVYEPYCGSGTSIIAAEKLGRCCYGMEMDPHYVDVIVKRWEDFTGQKAVKCG